MRGFVVEHVRLNAMQARLRRSGHIIWLDEGNGVKETMKMKARGTRAKGRPRMRWMDNIRPGMDKYGLEEGDARDRSRWRRAGILGGQGRRLRRRV